MLVRHHSNQRLQCIGACWMGQTPVILPTRKLLLATGCCSRLCMLSAAFTHETQCKFIESTYWQSDDSGCVLWYPATIYVPKHHCRRRKLQVAASDRQLIGTAHRGTVLLARRPYMGSVFSILYPIKYFRAVLIYVHKKLHPVMSFKYTNLTSVIKPAESAPGQST